MRKSYTFNSLWIKYNIFRPRVSEISRKSDYLTRIGKSIHFATENALLINAIGHFNRAIFLENSYNGDGLRSYLETCMNFYPYFNGDRRIGVAQEGVELEAACLKNLKLAKGISKRNIWTYYL